MEFIGKFHPIFLHLPIGLILGSFVLELIAWRKPTHDFSPAVKFLLGLGAITAIIAALLGYLLSLRGGYDLDLLGVHQWSGFGVAILASAFYFIRTRWANQKRFIQAGWALNILVLLVAGHYGGSLTHGKDYLTESAPPFLKDILGASKAANPRANLPLDSAIVFHDVVQPIMQRKCWDCHNSGKKKGGLNLEDPKAWKKGGQTGPLLVEGQPDQSLLLQRIFLPIDHKEHMPPDGKPQLLPSEVALLEWWIAQGGNQTQKVAESKLSKKIDQILKAEFGERDVYATLDVKPLNKKKLQQLQAEGLKIYPLAQESPLLEVSFSGDTVIGPQQLDALKKAKKQIVRLDLSHSGITNDQLKQIGELPHLVKLFLQHTTVSDAGLAHLEKLEYLEYLNLYRTNVGDDGLSTIAEMPNLKDVYLWQSKASKEKIEALQKQRPGVNIDFGAEYAALIQDTDPTSPETEEEPQEEDEEKQQTVPSEKDE